MAIIKLHKAEGNKPIWRQRHLDPAAMRKRLSLIYNVDVSAEELECRLIELEARDLLTKL